MRQFAEQQQQPPLETCHKPVGGGMSLLTRHELETLPSPLSSLPPANKSLPPDQTLPPVAGAGRLPCSPEKSLILVLSMPSDLPFKERIELIEREKVAVQSHTAAQAIVRAYKVCWLAVILVTHCGSDHCSRLQGLLACCYSSHTLRLRPLFTPTRFVGLLLF